MEILRMIVESAGNGTDYDQDGICDDIDECIGEYDNWSM